MPVRPMQVADIPAVLRIQESLRFQEWNSRQYEQELKASYTYASVYEESGNIVGYAVFHLLGADSELLSIAVSKGAQKKGIGKSLLLDGLARLSLQNGDCCFLEVREGNLNARRFYESHGFSQFATRKKYYTDGENAFLYRPEGVLNV
ncbi:ribosomal protein S18-alanine N-acetyltransferase [uncultured Fibrobacter sp.]|uniref:ribosomal protein S18-alanine N-acetyltransferase n=1 Tax=uncultured Fibrobacter sp. TaxID=261512 RepID=UPI0026286635|nr:ribosomal protein S18-alanine N-acetyltransferase [uncultured Fibrobacter sp.]